MAYIVRGGGGTGAIAGTGARYEIHSYPPVRLELKQKYVRKNFVKFLFSRNAIFNLFS